MLWLPQDDTSTVILTDAPKILTTDPDKGPGFDSSFSISADDANYLLYDLGNGQRLQLVRYGTGGSVAAVVPLGLEGFDRLESIRRLLAAIHDRVVPLDTRLTRQKRARHCRMLRVIDGYRDGATQQEIAQVIFRSDPVSRDEWQASSARHAIKTLLRDARALIAGGYRKLLRHRRPS